MTDTLLQTEPALPALNPALAALDKVFKAPPLTPALVNAIRLIAPQFDLSTSEASRAYWEADQNGSCWGEYQALAPLLKALPTPAKVLEIGPGMGRSLVFWAKQLGWSPTTTQLHAYEGEGDTTKYTLLGPRFEDSFCGNFQMLRQVLAHNGLHEVQIFDAQATPLAALPGPYDLLYSFYSVGFHWSLEHFLDDLLGLMGDHTLAAFTVPAEFEPFPALDRLAWRVIDWRPVWPENAQLKLLVLSKHALPSV